MGVLADHLNGSCAYMAGHMHRSICMYGRPTIVGVWIMEEFNNLHHTKLLAVLPCAASSSYVL